MVAMLPWNIMASIRSVRSRLPSRFLADEPALVGDMFFFNRSRAGGCRSCRPGRSPRARRSRGCRPARPKASIASWSGTFSRLVTAPVQEVGPGRPQVGRRSARAPGPNQRAVKHFVLQIGMRTPASARPRRPARTNSRRLEAPNWPAAPHAAELVLGDPEPGHEHLGRPPADGPGSPSAGGSRSSGRGTTETS